MTAGDAASLITAMAVLVTALGTLRIQRRTDSTASRIDHAVNNREVGEPTMAQQVASIDHAVNNREPGSQTMAQQIDDLHSDRPEGVTNG